MDKKDSTDQVNTLNPDELAEINSHGKRKTPRPLKKLAWWGVLVVPVLAIMTYLTVMYVRNKDVYARTGGAVITKSEFARARDSYQQFAEKSKRSDIKNDLDKYTLDQLLLEQALLVEAKKNNIAFNDTDIEDAILRTDREIKKQNSAQATIKEATIKAAVTYHIKEPEAIRSYRILALEDKLSEKFLKFRSISMFMTRWDYYGGTTNFTQSQADQLARSALENKIKPLFDRKEPDEKIIAVAKATQGRLEDLRPDTILVKPMDKANRDDHSTATFQDPRDWIELEKLSTVGDYTPIVKSENGGYYYIARLNRIGDGQFNSWDQYTEQIKAKTVVYGSSFNWKMLVTYQVNQLFLPNYKVARSLDSSLLCQAQDRQVSFVEKLISALLGSDQALAGCSYAETLAHTITYNGTAYYSNGSPHPGVKVYIENAANGYVCGLAGHTENRGPYITDAQGKWQTGWWTGDPFINPGAAHLTGDAFSCLMPWQARFVAGSCERIVPIDDADLGGGATYNGGNHPNINAILDCVDDGSVNISHIITQPDGTSTEGVLPGANAFTCINELSICSNVATEATKIITPATSGDRHVAVRNNVGGAPSLPAGWVLDHIDASYPSLGNSTVKVWPGDGKFVVGAGQATNLKVYFKKVPIPTITLTMNGFPRPDDQRGSTANNPVEILSDQSSGANLKWSLGGSSDSCVASNGWSGNKDPLGGIEDRAPIDTQVADKRIAYTITCSNSAGSSPPATVYVRYRRQFYPYTKTRNGDVMILNNIIVNEASTDIAKLAGSFANDDALAEYVVISATSRYFCSAKGYLFGLPVGGSQNYGCPSDGYMPSSRVVNPIFDNINRFASTATICDTDNPAQPYSVEMVPSATLAGLKDFAERTPGKDCPKIWVYNGDLTINNDLVVSAGRATIWVKGTVNIAGNISTSAVGLNNQTINTLPNLAIVAKKINIDPRVTRIDASLFAYAHGGSGDGVIDTCYPNSTISDCKKPLQIFGRVNAENGFALNRNAFDPRVDVAGPLPDNGSGKQPAEYFYGTGQSLIMPPPGLDDRISNDATGIMYNHGELNPQF